MSGHSKWHNIQKTKGAADAKRSAAFTKIAKEIIVAVKQGGSGDPNNNSRLATVIAKAKAANMPNDNIKRTIDKALGSGNTDNYESVTYEGYGPGGVAVIVEALTDNRQRTAPEVRHYFDKYGKGMGAQGCVSWSFDRKGVIIIDNEDGMNTHTNTPSLYKTRKYKNCHFIHKGKKLMCHQHIQLNKYLSTHIPDAVIHAAANLHLRRLDE